MGVKLLVGNAWRQVHDVQMTANCFVMAMQTSATGKMTL